MSVNTPKALVIGASGYLGRALHRVVARSHPEAMGLTRKTIQLENPDISITGCEDMGYEWGIITAAIPGLAYCEANPVETHKANVEGALSLARQLTDADI
ncbi:sugar nucleotide-binding protein, partial [Pseudodesulfovibrio sp.]|nr:sugar nucleotide-binding protein [Pseudodesulfovibrio sp.]